MEHYQNIIVAIDLDGGAEEVLQRVTKLFGQAGAKITVVSVVPTVSAMYGASIAASYHMAGAPIPDEDEIRAATLPKLQALAQETGLPEHEQIVDFGRADDIVLDLAEKRQADLIVMGSHGRHGIGLLLGSTTNAVLHRAKTDVLAIRLTK